MTGEGFDLGLSNPSPTLESLYHIGMLTFMADTQSYVTHGILLATIICGCSTSWQVDEKHVYDFFTSRGAQIVNIIQPQKSFLYMWLMLSVLLWNLKNTFITQSPTEQNQVDLLVFNIFYQKVPFSSCKAETENT